MSAVVHARVTEQLMRLRLRYVAERLDAVLNDAARAEPTYLDFTPCSDKKWMPSSAHGSRWA